MTPLLPAFTRAEPGNVYHMDAVSLLRRLPDASVGLIATDPPYGLAANDAFQAPRTMRRTDNGKPRATDDYFVAIREEWDMHAPVDWMAECARALRPGGMVVICAAMRSIYDFAQEGFRLGWKLVNDVTWVKVNPPPNFTGRAMTYATERILCFCPDGKNWTYNTDYARAMNGGVNFQDVWYFDVPHGETRIHPSQKPVDLMERIVGLFSADGETVADPFFGSGTTGIAALNLGRQFVGADITAEHIAGARNRIASWRGVEKRIDETVMQLGLFAA